MVYKSGFYVENHRKYFRFMEIQSIYWNTNNISRRILLGELEIEEE